MSTAAYGSSPIGAVIGGNPSQWDANGRVVGINGNEIRGMADKMLNSPMAVNSRLAEIQRFNSMLNLAGQQQNSVPQFTPWNLTTVNPQSMKNYAQLAQQNMNQGFGNINNIVNQDNVKSWFKGA